MPTSLLRSVCPYDCPDACGFLVEVRDGRAVAIRGDPEHPYARGAVCGKMARYERTVHSPDRVATPLVRTGPKGEGRFRRATWDEAVALVASRWKEIAAAHGGEAILPYSYAGTMGLLQRNAGHAFFHRLGASRLDRTICSPAKDAGWKAVMGATPGPDPDVAERSDLVVLWGIDAVATNVHFVSRAKAARRQGGRIWVVDTHETPTSAIADRTFVVRPGGDGALALGVVHVLAREGLADEAFLAEHAVGWPEWKAQVVAEWPPERAAAVSGVPADAIVELARGLGRARAPFLRVGSGLSRYGNGAMTVRTVVALAAVLGAHGKDGGGCLCGTSSSQAFDLAPVTREDLMARPTRVVNMNRLGWALTELRDPPVLSTYVYAANPAAVCPDQNVVLRGLAREDLFTVVHERFMTDTARYADVVLPATTSLEHPDLYRSYGQYVLQRARAVVPPVGEAKPNWETFQLLARAMGFEDPVFSLPAERAIDALLDVPSPWRAGVDRAALDAGRPVVLRPPPGPRWRTPSGKIELLNRAHREPLPRWLPTHEEAGALPLRLQTAPAQWALNSTFMEREDLRARRGGMRLRLSPADAAARGLADGARVVAWNERGEATFELEIAPGVPPGVAVAPGVFWLADAPGARNVNALTSQRLTDEAGGSTFYDTRVDVRPA